MNISDRIHNLRKMKDISQEQFADALTWYDSQDVAAYASMYILIIFGIMMWGIGLTPLSLIYNICIGSKVLAPYPIYVGAMRYYILFWFGYILVGIIGKLIKVLLFNLLYFFWDLRSEIPTNRQFLYSLFTIS